MVVVNRYESAVYFASHTKQSAFPLDMSAMLEVIKNIKARDLNKNILDSNGKTFKR